MLKALIFKEWLKIRWAALLTLAFFLLIMVVMTLNLSYVIRLKGANNIWYDIIIRGYLFFDYFKYLPVITGAAIAAFQFFPEITENRLKLTLHLPIGENSILMYMAAIGSITVLIVLVFSIIVLSIITRIYFPVQVLTAVLLTASPWIISGLIAYFSTITIFVEPIWKKRIFFLVVSVLIISWHLEPVNFNAFSNTLLPFFVLALFFSITVLFSGHRFRKGVLK